MLGKFFLILFFSCLFPCAVLVLFFIWAGGPPAPVWFQIAATFFVVGLASFLIWFVDAVSNIRR